MTDQNLIYQIGLTLIKGIGNITAKQVIAGLDDIKQLFTEKAHVLVRISGITPRIITEIRKTEILVRAEKELEFIRRNEITPLFISDPDYPFRLKECVDAPVMLYYKGNVDLNSTKVINIVGTRHATLAGKEITAKIIKDFASIFPDMIVVSGLAYGIDIAAHKAALSEGISTIGVLAHGLDRIYPYEHRNVAAQMIHSGGLLTDFISGTQPGRQNFVKRNRIVAGISDCTIVIESAAKGGAMITANIANSYNRDVFAVPGNVNSPYSSGCNQLIKSRKAALVENMEDIVGEMCWTLGNSKNQAKIIQKQFFPDVSPEGQSIVDILSISGNMHINILSIELNMPVSKLSSTLFELEMSGIVRSFPGGMYSLYKN